MKQNIKIAKQLIRIAKSLLAEYDFTKKFPKIMKDLGFYKSNNKYMQNFELDHYNDIDVMISEPEEKNDKFICLLSEKDSHGNSDYVKIQFTSNEFATELENGMKELKGFGKIYKSIDYNKINDLIVEYNMADQRGRYENFTGTIEWGKIKAKVRNATFDIYYTGYDFYIDWEDGIWCDGQGKNITWNNGTWKNGTWHDGIWNNGTWENGTWENGIWDRGTWKDGTWKKGLWHKGTWENGTWENGYWEDGNWIKGNWEGGRDEHEDKHEKGDSPDKWYMMY